MSPSHHKSWANSCLSLFFSITFADFLAPCWLEWCDDDDNVEVSIWEVFCARIMIHVMCSVHFMCCLCCALVLLYIGLTCHISVQCICRVGCFSFPWPSQCACFMRIMHIYVVLCLGPPVYRLDLSLIESIIHRTPVTSTFFSQFWSEWNWFSDAADQSKIHKSLSLSLSLSSKVQIRVSQVLVDWISFTCSASHWDMLAPPELLSLPICQNL